ncbi:MAG: hypothetical protein EZS28_021889 [Streblomastix strix]|uniref:Tyr recombinase domain-containing protein n=1 Tax=Streblomastix strix TaxID=222440 RepID=A0A5J4VJH2_9EUKA|nr:MAG: hypothetical protein EZS28_021889 [Streblomastix strix]
MAEFMKESNITIDMLLFERPDIHIINALCWINEQRGKKRKSKLLLLKTHMNSTLTQFSNMPNISDSPLIKSFIRCINLNTDSKARYNVIWDIDILFKYIKSTIFVTSQEKQLLTMTLLICFSAARMTELQRITMQDIIQDKDIVTIATVIKKGNKIRNEKISLLQRNNELCPVFALNNWIQERQKLNIRNEYLFWNFEKQIPATSYYCSHLLTSILRNSGIQPPYNGPSIRHATMTKLRASGASVTEVNTFSRHILTSTVVDAFYFRPVQRDLGILLTNNNSLHDPQHQTRCSEAVDELNTFEDQSTSTSQDSDEVQER